RVGEPFANGVGFVCPVSACVVEVVEEVADFVGAGGGVVGCKTIHKSSVLSGVVAVLFCPGGAHPFRSFAEGGKCLVVANFVAVDACAVSAPVRGDAAREVMLPSAGGA